MTGSRAGWNAAPRGGTIRAVRHTPRLWFSPHGPVTRAEYLAGGLTLGVLKYAAEAAFLRVAAARWLTPGEFLSPSMDRLAEFDTPGPWAGPLYVLWTLPFVWVAAVMSVRRAADAGTSPWLGLLVLTPFLNFALIAVLCLLPTAAPADGPPPPVEPGGHDDLVAGIDGWEDHPAADRSRAGAWALGGVLFGPVYTLLTVAACVYVLGDYGAPLFFQAPVLVGAAAGFCGNAVRRRGGAETVVLATLAVLASGGGLLVVAWEGVICLAMALPLAWPMAVVGGLVGRAIANATVGDRVPPRHPPPEPPWRDGGAAACFLLLPAGSLLAPADPAPVRPVTTAVTVDAPPAVVWDRVIAFPPLPPPDDDGPDGTGPGGWLFRTGVAYPVGAVIEGRGVGAVRRCRFSTGEFVEPVTAWEPGRRLAFDVTSQPDPMRELHPWADPHPPHLSGTFRSVRGEFRLDPLPGGRTRLSGTTWYRVHMAPQTYWAAWSDAVLHRVHARVLGHVKGLAEGDLKVTSQQLLVRGDVDAPERD